MRVATFLLIGLAALFPPAIAGTPPASAQTLSEAVAAHKRGDYAAAYRGFRRLAGQGVARAQAALGLMYENGRGVRRNDAQAVRWYRRAAEQGLAAAQSALGVMYAKGRGVPQSDSEAVRWFRRAAEGGDALAQGILGRFYENGVGVPRDPVRAYKWYRLAASSTNAKVRRRAAANMRRLGQRLTPAQLARAQRLARQWRPRKPTARATRPRAERPPAGTSATLAFRKAVRAHARGDHAAAYRGFRRLAEQGFAAARFNLGLMYSGGKGVPQDHAEAAKWYRRAAEQGDADAQNMLGLVYGRGHGVRKNYAAAVRWHRRAAERGHAAAQFNLGNMYRRGHGVAKNAAAAARWYRRAAEQGVAQAQNNLGLMYQSGSGVPRDPVAALKWYTIAAARFSDSNNRGFAARNRDPIEGDDAFIATAMAVHQGVGIDVETAGQLVLQTLEDRPRKKDGSEFSGDEVAALPEALRRLVLIEEFARKDAQIVLEAFGNGDKTVDLSDHDAEPLAGLLDLSFIPDPDHERLAAEIKRRQS